MAPKDSAAASTNNAYLNPDTAVAGGLRNHFEGTVELARYEVFDFMGKARPTTTKAGRYLSGKKMAIHVRIVDCDDGIDKPVDEYWPGDPVEDFVPNDEGDGFEAITGRTGFSNTCEIIQAMNAIVETGLLKKSELTSDPTFLEGKRFYWVRKAPLYAEKKTDPTKRGDENVLLPTKYIGEAKGKGASKPGARSGSGASAGAGLRGVTDDTPDSEITDIGVKLTKEAISVYEEENPKAKSVSREDVGTGVFTLLMSKYKKDYDASVRKAVNKLFEDDDFLEQNEGRKTWSYDAKKGVVEL
jgi:hypothetical protein